MDDVDLITRLRQGMHAHTKDTTVPHDFLDQARQTARRRSAHRRVLVGVPLLVAVGAVSAVAVGVGQSGSSGQPTQGPHGASAEQVRQTAYIVRRVDAAAGGRNHDVARTLGYESGRLSPNGSLFDLGAKTDQALGYFPRDGAAFTRETTYDANGSVYEIMIHRWAKTSANRTGAETTITINPGKRMYSRTVDPTGRTRGAGPNLLSPSSVVRKLLTSGRVTKTGILTIDGRRAIGLSIRPSGASAGQTMLYVDARTYEPLRTVFVDDGHLAPEINDWLPATPHNLNMAENDSVPAGYTRVSPTHVDKP